ncbi:hypothetical protein L9F63_010801 [Diploptera punctata]|uniref:Uncharacterized protein n=1 Tax=Diploptera punctata TaxID=6984 RepID=A0AAD8EQC1_DIPPU|nr:hypothetical protein L9F63_010801 [Diploptera punctata]
MYEEPTTILQMQPSGTEGCGVVGVGSPQSIDLSSPLPASPNVSVNQDIREKMASQTPVETFSMSPPLSNPLSHENCVTSEIEPESLKTLDISNRVSVLQGTYTVKSPPLEVVKEESVASVSHLDTLSEHSLLSNNSALFVNARNDVLISAIMSDSAVSCVNQVLVDKHSSQLASGDNQSVAVSVALVTTSNSQVPDCYKFQSSSRTNNTILKGKEEIKSDLTVNFSLTDKNCDRTKTGDKRRLLNASVLLEGGTEQGREVLNSGTESIWQETRGSVSPAGIRQRKMATTHAPKLSSLSTDNTVPNSNTDSQVL